MPEGYLGQLFVRVRVLPLPLLIDLDCFQLDAIPTVGFSNPILSYLSALRFKLHGIAMLKYGYENVSACVLTI